MGTLPKIRILKNREIITEVMTDGMVRAFESMMARCDIETALDFIDVGGNALPTASVIRKIIFEILMVNCEDKVAQRAGTYLRNVLRLNPSSNNFDYQTALQDESGTFPDVWSVFTHLMMSCFSYPQIVPENSTGPELIKSTNCYILIDYFTSVLTKSASLEDFLFGEEEPANKERFKTFLGWINNLYKPRPKEVLIDEQLHILFVSIVNSKVMDDGSTSGSMLFNKDSLLTTVNDILTHCPDAFSHIQSLKRFCIFTELPYLRAKICQCQLDNLLNQQKVDKEGPLTLEGIVNLYIFPSFLNEKRKKKENGSILRRQSPRKLRELFTKKPATNNGTLHELCRKEKCGDLLELIIESQELDLNEKNSLGYTPLHEACLVKSYACARLLLYDVKDSAGKADCAATDNEGRTPLHCAAFSGAIDIVKMLVKHTGIHLVMCKDKYDAKALDYADSKELRQILSQHEMAYLSEQDLASKSTNLSSPVLKNKDEYSTYLYSLYVLLSFYLEEFHLQNCEETPLASHKQSMCVHYKSNVTCDEDFAARTTLPQDIHTFLSNMKQNAQNSNCKIDVECIPLMLLGKSVI